MKKLIFGLLLLPGTVLAQKYELGLGAGISLNTKPSGNLYMKGDKMTINYASSLHLLYNINEHWQTGLELHVSQLSGKTDVTQTDISGNTSEESKRIVYAKTDLAACAVFNGKMSVKNGYGYGGVALGYGVGRHDSKTLNDNEAYRTPDGGNGVVLGLQIGYVKGLSKHFGVSAEAAMRYHQMNYDTPSGTFGAAETLKYSVISFPITVGIRYQIFTSETKEKERQQLMDQGATAE
jgi:hypothetical protein